MHESADPAVPFFSQMSGIAVFDDCEPPPLDRLSVSPRKYLGRIKAPGLGLVWSEAGKAAEAASRVRA